MLILEMFLWINYWGRLEISSYNWMSRNDCSRSKTLQIYWTSRHRPYDNGFHLTCPALFFLWTIGAVGLCRTFRKFFLWVNPSFAVPTMKVALSTCGFPVNPTC